MLIDYLTETMVKAGKAGKFGDVSRLAKVIIEAAGLNRRDDAPIDPAELERPVALHAQRMLVLAMTQRRLSLRVFRESRTGARLRHAARDESTPHCRKCPRT
jgi:hypothetical protein